MRRVALAALLACGPAGAQAPGETGATVTSSAPDAVSVTVYRDPDRASAAGIVLAAPGGFALVTETRTVRLPRGKAVLRFEGVADGIVPVSAIVEGLPGGTVEKNRDARLLSPAALVDGTLGRQVTVTRTDPATGQRRSEQATIVAGPSPGVVLRTAAGIEALRCSGLPERLAYDRIPAGLSARPVLSVTTVSPAARTATVTLSYLSSGFDWNASYVATIAPGGDRLDLSAWLTLANANPAAFDHARVAAVAGRVNRQAMRAMAARAGALSLQCHPLGTTTSNLRERDVERGEALQDDDIRLTASRMMIPAPVALSAPLPPPPPEDLGDLKLYRVPERVTIAPRAQKQVALLAAAGVPFERRYHRAIEPGRRMEAAPTAIRLVVRNMKAARLGIPLPAGTTTLYGWRGGARLLLGTGDVGDRTEGETLWIAAGTSRNVLVAQRPMVKDRATITVVNANPVAVAIELPIGVAGQRIVADGARLERIDGVATWRTMVPGHASVAMTYRYGEDAISPAPDASGL